MLPQIVGDRIRHRRDAVEQAIVGADAPALARGPKRIESLRGHAHRQRRADRGNQTHGQAQTRPHRQRRAIVDALAGHHQVGAPGVKVGSQRLVAVTQHRQADLGGQRPQIGVIRTTGQQIDLRTQCRQARGEIRHGAFDAPVLEAAHHQRDAHAVSPCSSGQSALPAARGEQADAQCRPSKQGPETPPSLMQGMEIEQVPQPTNRRWTASRTAPHRRSADPVARPPLTDGQEQARRTSRPKAPDQSGQTAPAVPNRCCADDPVTPPPSTRSDGPPPASDQGMAGTGPPTKQGRSQPEPPAQSVAHANADSAKTGRCSRFPLTAWP